VQMSERVIFNFAGGGPIPHDDSLFSAYLDLYQAKLRSGLPEPLATREYTSFKMSLDDLLSQYRFIFQEKSELRRAILVLGKVQSGKTAHLLGNIAWAADDTSVSFGVVLTGTALALNNQGIDRINSDLVAIKSTAIHVLEVPTSPTSPKFEDFYNELKSLVTARESGIPTKPMPVLVTIKKPGRIRAVQEAKRRLVSELGDNVSTLLIDDETDQASQNAGANAGRSAATYAALAKLYETGRSVMLSYTATPQAVLLTEKYGRLRPDYCHVIDPRAGYFGLEDVVSSKFSSNIKIVDDLNQRITTHKTPPLSLERAIASFLLVALVRDQFPDVFFSQARVQDDFSNRMRSVQMLIHQSSVKVDHAHLKQLVAKSLESLEELAQRGDFNTVGLFSEEWASLMATNPSQIEIPEVLPTSLQRELLDSFTQLSIRVVNSDIKKSDPEQTLPVSASEWEASRLWILIGGEILGRGLTIPQLCISYFVRGTTSPKFDTVAQQMRFCGYRQDYKWATRIFSTQTNVDLFHYMNGIERVLWRKARKWSSGRVRLSGATQPVYYASPVNTPLDPCRRAVQDPNLQDLKFGKNTEVIATLQDIFNPLQVLENIELLNDILPSGLRNKLDGDGFGTLEHFGENNLASLLLSWSGSSDTRGHLRAIASLFDESLGEWGLANIPVTLIVKQPNLSDYQSNAVFSRLSPIMRGASVTEADASKWIEIRDLGEMSSPLKWPTLKVPHVGAGQRAKKARIGYDSTVVIIEPIKGVITNTEKALAWGLGLTIFRPDGFELRILGHR
jgi:hypothetical protein